MSSLSNDLAALFVPNKEYKTYNDTLFVVPVLAILAAIMPLVTKVIIDGNITAYIVISILTIILIISRVTMVLADPEVKPTAKSVIINALFFEFMFGWNLIKDSYHRKRLRKASEARDVENYIKHALIMAVIYISYIMVVLGQIGIPGGKTEQYFLAVLVGYFEFVVIAPALGSVLFSLWFIYDEERQCILFEIREEKRLKDNKMWKEASQRLHFTNKLTEVTKKGDSNG